MSTWNKSYSADIDATPSAIWAVLADTATWNSWNAGVKSIRLDGAFATGSRFAMELPDGEIIESTLVSVVDRQHFIDETTLGDTVVRVEHRIEPVADDTSRVTYAITVQGPEPQAIGEAVSGDFPTVIAGLGQYVATRRQSGLHHA